jgi:hypothetical protein
MLISAANHSAKAGIAQIGNAERLLQTTGGKNKELPGIPRNTTEFRGKIKWRCEMKLRSAGWTSDFGVFNSFIPQVFAAPMPALVLQGWFDGG